MRWAQYQEKETKKDRQKGDIEMTLQNFAQV